MKSVKKTVLILGCLVILMGMDGCKDNSGKFIITVNKDVPACGITDPVTNSAWLAEFCKNHTPTDFIGITINISVYKNKVTAENHYVVSYSSSTVVEYSSQEVYDCSGNKLFVKAKADPAPTGWTEFFAQNELVATIWELTKE